jgi:hypothetical protein
MKGSEAVRAARRREADALAAADELRAELNQVREDHRKVVLDLEVEIRRLRSEHAHEAAQLAQREVERRIEEAGEERRRRGFSDDLAGDHQYKQDRFAYNACRYLSMTEGQPPHAVLPRVMTWLLNEDYYGPISRVNLLVKCGLPPDGWVAKWMGVHKHLNGRRAKNRYKQERPIAYSLDRAWREQFDAIHPDYKPEWYPKMVYLGMEVVDDVSDE